jgi:serine/threonine protein kinase
VFFDVGCAAHDGADVDGSAAPDDRQDLIGRTLDGRFAVTARIGGGGTGLVFEGVCMHTGQILAIKTLRPSLCRHLDLGTRLKREVEVSRRVLHPGVVRILGEGTLSDGTPYLVMPRLNGESLVRLLQRYGELPPATIMMLANRVASILHSAHTAGYVHRDIKPEHIHLSKSARGELCVHLLDFGVCWSAHASPEEKSREAGRVFGTPRYVSPEQAAGETLIDGRADLFGLGVVMFEALTGCVPFSAPSVAKLLLCIIRDDAPRVRDMIEVEPEIDNLVAQLLTRDRARRMSTARSLTGALLPYAGQRTGAEQQILNLLRDTGNADGASTTVAGDTPNVLPSRVWSAEARAGQAP